MARNRFFLALIPLVFLLGGVALVGEGEQGRSLSSLDQVLGQLVPEAGNQIDTWVVSVPADGTLWVALYNLNQSRHLRAVLLESRTNEMLGILDINPFSVPAGAIQWQVPSEGGRYLIQVTTRGSEEVSYVLATIATTQLSTVVLAPPRGTGRRLLEAALGGLGLPYTMVSSTSELVQAITQDPELVIIANFPADSDTYVPYLREYLEKGGRCLVFGMDLSNQEALLELMGSVFTGDFPQRELLVLVDTFTTTVFVFPWYIEGSHTIVSKGCSALQPRNGSIAAAGYMLPAGDHGIIVSHEGRAILNAFFIDSIGIKYDAISLIKNELFYTLLASHWEQARNLPLHFRSDLKEVESYLQQGKYVAAIEPLRRAVLRFVPRSNWWNSWYFNNYFIPQAESEISFSYSVAQSLVPFLSRLSALSIPVAEYVHQAIPFPLEGFTSFTTQIPWLAEGLRAWASTHITAVERAEQTGIGLFICPPSPVFNRLYPRCPDLPLVEAICINYTEQTQSVMLSVEVEPTLLEHETTTLTIPPTTSEEFSLSPSVIPTSFPGPTQMELVIKMDGRVHYDIPVRFLASDEAPLFRRLYGYLSFWVTPTAPSVTALAKEAMARLEDIGGSAAPGEIALAIWETLQEYGFGYLEAIPASTPWSQRIRTPDEALESHGGNCVEATLLLSSLLEACGVNPYLCLIPAENHAMVGWQEADGSLRFLETTFLGGGTTFDLALLWGTKTWYEYAQDAIEITTLSPIETYYTAYLLNIAAIKTGDE